MKIACSILFAVLISVQANTQVDTLKVYFDTDDPFLNTRALKNLESNFKKLDQKKDFIVIGYADERGGDYYNDMLSMRRAQSVATFMEQKGIAKKRIKLVYGKGAVSRTNGNLQVYTRDRRVDIVATAPRRASKDTIGMPDLATQLPELKVGESIVLENVHFFLGSFKPTPSSYVTINELLKVMREHPTLRIRLEGHICCIDMSSERQIIGGQQLSTIRAEVIKTFLFRNGIQRDRVESIGFGKSKPLIKKEVTEDDKQRNRRVEARILGK